MRAIRWTPEAFSQLEAIVKGFRAESPDTARNVARLFVDRIEQLATFPDPGRPGEVGGTREFGPPYVIVYRSTAEIVEILYVSYWAEDWR